MARKPKKTKKRKPCTRRVAAVKRLATTLRWKVFKRDKFTCVYCGAKPKGKVGLQVDHKVPISEGGKSTMGNLVTACAKCNRGKGNDAAVKKKTAAKRKPAKRKKAAKKRKVGRPRRVVSPTAQRLLIALAKSGATVTEMCKVLKCNRAFFYRTLAESSGLRTAIQKARVPADDRVEHSLYERANGYEYTETAIESDSDGEVIKKKVTTKHMAPDVAAAFIWLKNRRPEAWKDRREVAVSGVSLPEALDLCDEK